MSQLKKIGIQFLKELNNDKEDIEREFRIKTQTVKNDLQRNNVKSNYTLPELLKVIDVVESDVKTQFEKALATISVKGVQRLRTAIEYGLDSVSLYEEQETTPTTASPGKPGAVPPTKVKMAKKGPLPSGDPLPAASSQPMMMNAQAATAVELKMNASNEATMGTINTTDSVNAPEKKEEKLNENTLMPELEGALTHMTSVASTTRDTEVINSELLEVMETLEVHRNRLAITIAKIREAEPEKAAQLIKELETVEQRLQKLATFLENVDVSSEDKLTFDAQQTKAAISEIVAPIEEVVQNIIPKETKEAKSPTTAEPEKKEVVGQKIEQLYDQLKTRLIAPAKALDQLTNALSTMAMSQDKLSQKEKDELERKLGMFREELRKKQFFLEHTRKLLATNPKFQCIFILQELGTAMPLSSLAKSVGVAAIVLRRELQEFINRNLVRLSDEEDPIVELCFE